MTTPMRRSTTVRRLRREEEPRNSKGTILSRPYKPPSSESALIISSDLSNISHLHSSLILEHLDALERQFANYLKSTCIRDSLLRPKIRRQVRSPCCVHDIRKADIF